MTRTRGLLVGLFGLFLLYAGYVAYAEARLGYLQPHGGSTIVIATFDDGARRERVVRLTRLEGRNYIAAQHWPRAWYRQALATPQIEVKMDEVFEPLFSGCAAGLGASDGEGELSNAARLPL
jgi:hypothetical protein